MDSSVQISMGLVRHRAGKALALQFMLQTAVFGMLFATVVRKLRPQHRFILSNTLSVSPSAEQFAENCAFWLVEAALDSLLDELATISHYNLVIQSFFTLVMLILFIRLAVLPTGHAVFVLKSCEVLLATAVARTIDNPLWVVIAIGATSLLAFSSRVCPLETPGVLRSGVVSYFVLNVASSFLYQALQNTFSRFAWFKIIRVVHSIGLVFAVEFMGTPATWAIYDVLNWIVFLCSKVLLDTTAIIALSAE